MTPLQMAGSVAIQLGDAPMYVRALDNGLFTAGAPHDQGVLVICLEILTLVLYLLLISISILLFSHMKVAEFLLTEPVIHPYIIPLFLCLSGRGWTIT